MAESSLIFAASQRQKTAPVDLSSRGGRHLDFAPLLCATKRGGQVPFFRRATAARMAVSATWDRFSPACRASAMREGGSVIWTARRRWSGGI